MSHRTLGAFAAGTLFSIGLGVSGMTQPERVLGFLDVAGAWDMTLGFVMVGAIAAYMFFYRALRGEGQPVLNRVFAVPTRRDIDASLLGGAALFGVGWGLGGICPGPGFATLSTALPGVLVFMTTMLLGSAAVGFANKRKQTSVA